MPMEQNVSPAAEGPFVRLLLETVDLGGEGETRSREKQLAEACRLFEADVLYTVTPVDRGWCKAAFGPDGAVGESKTERLTGIVRNVLTRRSGFLESRLAARGAFHRHRDGWPGIDTGSYIAVPLQRCGHGHGALVLLRSTLRPSFVADDLRRAESFAAALTVRADVAEKLAELGRMARTDPLTRLANYRCLREELARAFHTGDHLGESFAIIMVDVDNLRRVNDHFGHLAGSEILRRFARVLERNVRAGDMVAKYGGDEFIVLLHEATREEAVIVSERIREAVGRDVSGVKPKDRVSCSCGIALFPEDGSDYASLITAADRALVRAKMGGRDPGSVEEPEQRRAA
jgi:diguanylate cyclase (GGDEF)-like protein